MSTTKAVGATSHPCAGRAKSKNSKAVTGKAFGKRGRGAVKAWVLAELGWIISYFKIIMFLPLIGLIGTIFHESIPKCFGTPSKAWHTIRYTAFRPGGPAGLNAKHAASLLRPDVCRQVQTRGVDVGGDGLGCTAWTSARERQAQAQCLSSCWPCMLLLTPDMWHVAWSMFGLYFGLVK